MTLCTPGISPACTSVSMDHEDGPFAGANLDWPVSDGLIVINKKGFKKTRTNRRRFLGAFAIGPIKRTAYRQRLERISRYPETVVCGEVKKS